MLLSWFRRQPVESFQVSVPVLVLGTKRGGRYPSLTEGILMLAAGLDARLVEVQTESHLPDLRVLFQHPEHGVFRGPAERHIAVLLPVLRI